MQRRRAAVRDRSGVCPSILRYYLFQRNSKHIFLAATSETCSEDAEGDQTNCGYDENPSYRHACNESRAVEVCGQAIQFKKHKTAYPQHERKNADNTSHAKGFQCAPFFLLRFCIYFLCQYNPEDTASRRRESHEKHTHRPSENNITQCDSLRKADREQIYYTEEDCHRRKCENEAPRSAPGGRIRLGDIVRADLVQRTAGKLSALLLPARRIAAPRAEVHPP